MLTLNEKLTALAREWEAESKRCDEDIADAPDRDREVHFASMAIVNEAHALALRSLLASASTPEETACACPCATHPEGGCACGCDCGDVENLLAAAREEGRRALAAAERRAEEAERRARIDHAFAGDMESLAKGAESRAASLAEALRFAADRLEEIPIALSGCRDLAHAEQAERIAKSGAAVARAALAAPAASPDPTPTEDRHDD